MPWTLEQILSATGGKLMRRGTRSAFGEVVTDSKKVGTNSVFVALKGQKFDGHRFAKDAGRRGAGCLIVHEKIPLAPLKAAAVVRVKDTLAALGDLARCRRLAVAPKVLAITGSNGKTTTKEMVAAILARASLGGRPLKGRVLKTEGNFNNLVGLPLTLLRLTGREKVAVVGPGTRNPREIPRPTPIAPPDTPRWPLGAAALPRGVGVDPRAIGAGVEAVRPFPMRMGIEGWNGAGVINDASNANPASMEAALRTLGGIRARGEKIAVLGDMLELGGEARARHLALGRQAARYGVDRLYLLGKQARLVARGALAAGMERDRVVIGRSHAHVAALVRGRARRGGWILLKGSRGMKMEKVLQALRDGGA